MKHTDLSTTMNPVSDAPAYTVGPPVLSAPGPEHDYSVYLQEKQICYKTYLPYLLVGNIPEGHGWLVHISIVRQQIHQLLTRLLPELNHRQLSFLLPINSDEHNRILDGRHGYNLIGKVLSIFINGDQQALELTQKILRLTEGCCGPEIPSGIHLGSCVYTSYGSLLSFARGIIPASLTAARDHQLIFPLAQPYPKRSALPHGLQWPFASIAPFRGKTGSRLVKLAYLHLETLKDDPKGKVMKCIEIKQFFNMRWCVLKQGKAFHCFDDHGRDIQKRLHWQYQLHRSLSVEIAIPKAFDFFEWKGHVYMAMEYLEGISLSEQITALYAGNIWQSLDNQKRLILAGYALQVISIMEKLHALEYVHRDLNPENFMVGPDRQLFLLDFELCYSLKESYPSPPFDLGTPGYISPQQLLLKEPGFPDDIFSLGGLFIKIFTGLSPLKFDCREIGQLLLQLDYFIPFSALTALIIACRQPEPLHRPSLDVLKKALTLLKMEIAEDKNSSPIICKGLPVDLYTTIYKAIRVLSDPDPMRQCVSWPVHSAGISNGLSGILYVLAIAEKAGFKTKQGEAAANMYLAILQKEFMWGPLEMEPGLLNGTAGAALALSELYQAGLITTGQVNPGQLHACLLTSSSPELHLAGGLTGQGIAVLHLLPHIDPRIGARLLHEITHGLLQSQQEDGSWILKDQPEHPGIKLPGLFYGVAGIIYFLLLRSMRVQNNAVTAAIRRALDWLSGQRQLKGGHYLWTLNPHVQTIDPWLTDGISGIALVFIKAYAVFRDAKYKEIATSALSIHPDWICSNALSFASGIAGLGEVYLEAASVFKEPEWQMRADHIAGLLLHCGYSLPGGYKYWLSDENHEPSLGLLNGHAGLLHFLMRYARPDRIGFPLLNMNI